MIFRLYNWYGYLIAPFQFNVAAAVIGSAVVGAVGSSMASDSASEASEQAAGAQSQAAANQVAESRRQFDEIRQLLNPYVQAGAGALTQQQNLLGLGGAEAQKNAIASISNSPQMMAMQQQGENAILQNASATGGLRGGNTQGALAQFRPQLLNQLISQQYDRLGGLVNVGQSSAAGVGAAGQFATGQINNAFQQQGAAAAGNALAQGRADASMYSGMANAAGQAFGSGAFNNLFGSPTSTASVNAANYQGMGNSFGSTPFKQDIWSTGGAY